MKYIIRSHYSYILILILALGCSSKKDIISEQTPSVSSEEIAADNGSKTQPESQQAGQNKINDIRLSEGLNGTEVFINATRKPNYTHFKLAKPDRIIIDIPDIANEEPIKEFNPESGFVSSIRTSLITDKELKYLRVEIVLKSPVSYTALSDDSTIIVNIKKNSLKQNELNEPKAASSTSSNLINIHNEIIGKSNVIKLQLQNAIPKFTSYKLVNPARLVVELENAHSQIIPGFVNINENNVTKIRIGQKGNYLKIVFDIQGNSVPEFEIRQSPPYLIVALGSEAITAEMKNKQPLSAQKAEQSLPLSPLLLRKNPLNQKTPLLEIRGIPVRKYRWISRMRI